MGLWQSILAGIVALVAIAILIEMIIKRNQPRPPLAKQFLGDDIREEDEDKPELGMEAVDWEVIRASERGNKSAASLGARDMQFWSRQTRFIRKRTQKSDQAPEGRNKEQKR